MDETEKIILQLAGKCKDNPEEFINVMENLSEKLNTPIMRKEIYF